mmetsp:Transcript_41975/g.100030  ORF Transcript_41975/g.100030 Transcript_41975/m.100030 type:complete len:267 (-) Transcript_41975:5564-6364(-)
MQVLHVHAGADTRRGVVFPKLVDLCAVFPRFREDLPELFHAHVLQQHWQVQLTLRVLPGPFETQNHVVLHAEGADLQILQANLCHAGEHAAHRGKDAPGARDHRVALQQLPSNCDSRNHASLDAGFGDSGVGIVGDLCEGHGREDFRDQAEPKGPRGAHHIGRRQVARAGGAAGPGPRVRHQEVGPTRGGRLGTPVLASAKPGLRHVAVARAPGVVVTDKVSHACDRPLDGVGLLLHDSQAVVSASGHLEADPRRVDACAKTDGAA